MQTRPLADWYRNRCRPDGLGTWCKPCHRTAYNERHRDWQVANLRRTRKAAEAVYGGCCSKCGSTERLQFDHVNGDGAAHRQRENVQAMYRRISRQGVLADVDLQLLCICCHWEKTRANGETRALRRRTSI